MALVIGAVAWVLLLYPRQEGPGGGRAVPFVVAADDDVGRLAQRLGEAGVVAEPRLFATYLRLLGSAESLREGAVVLSDDMNPGQVARRVCRGLGPARVRVTVPEGLNRWEIGRRLEAQGVCSAADFVAKTQSPAFLERNEIEASSAEGYLFPDTYELRLDMPPNGVAERMVRNFRVRMVELLEQEAAGMAGLGEEFDYGVHEVIVLASVVEEEAAAAVERPTIAGVFLNRLRSSTFRPRHRLQADPTVTYGCLAEPAIAASCERFDGRTITRAMLSDRANRYNTYRHGGLPPGPISNPGLAALRAVLRAEQHDYLYFVARGQGRHTFSATLADHNEAVDAYRDMQ